MKITRETFQAEERARAREREERIYDSAYINIDDVYVDICVRQM